MTIKEPLTFYVYKLIFLRWFYVDEKNHPQAEDSYSLFAGYGGKSFVIVQDKP
tara:strand:- start:194 stop:352 length:159 start_codon:yes stop_codon:yes gene_type:complete